MDGGSQSSSASASTSPLASVGGAPLSDGACPLRATPTPIATAKPMTIRTRMMMTTFTGAAQP
jgi:hypothetical protein